MQTDYLSIGLYTPEERLTPLPAHVRRPYRQIGGTRPSANRVETLLRPNSSWTLSRSSTALSDRSHSTNISSNGLSPAAAPPIQQYAQNGQHNGGLHYRHVQGRQPSRPNLHSGYGTGYASAAPTQRRGSWTEAPGRDPIRIRQTLQRAQSGLLPQRISAAAPSMAPQPQWRRASALNVSTNYQPQMPQRSASQIKIQLAQQEGPVSPVADLIRKIATNNPANSPTATPPAGTTSINALRSQLQRALADYESGRNEPWLSSKLSK